MDFDLAGHVRLHASLDVGRSLEAIGAEMDPYAGVAGGEGAGGDGKTPEVVLTHVRSDAPQLEELQLAAVDGLVTGVAGGDLYLLAGGLRARVPDALGDQPARIEFDPGFPMRRLFRHVVRPALQLRSLAGGSVACHAAAVERDGRAILVAGWSESGKTETALALVEAGAHFLTDKWTLLGFPEDAPDATGLSAAAFPISVGVRRWVLRYLPRLSGSLPRRARGRLMAAGAAAVLSAPIRGRDRLRGFPAILRDGAERAVAIADRVGLSPSEIATAYGHSPIRDRVPVGLVVVLRTVPGIRPSARPADPRRTSRRLAASAVTERQAYLALRQRAAYAAGSDPAAPSAARLEADRLETMLANVPIVEVSAPFPADPRMVVEALAPWLTGTP